MRGNILFILALFALLLRLSHAQGQTTAPTFLPFQALITDAGDNPRISVPVSIIFEITNGAENCVLYRETHGTNTDTKGMVSLAIGTGGGVAVAAPYSSIDQVFENNTPITCVGGGGTILAAGAGRKIRFNVNGDGWTPGVDMGSVPYAFQARYAESAGLAYNTNRIQGTNLNVAAPANGHVLTYSGGQWVNMAPATSGITALTGDVTAAGTGSVAATIANDAVTSAKIATNAVTDAKIASGISTSKLTALPNSTAVVVTDGAGLLTTSALVSTTEVNYLDGVTANIQTQFTGIATALAGKQDAVAPVNGGIMWTNATAPQVSAAGTAGQVLTSGGAGAPTWTSVTAANTTSTLVFRDATGNFSANTISAAGGFNGNVTGNLTGNVTGAASANVLKAGDTMTGALNITAAGTALGVTNDATVGGTLTANNLTATGSTTLAGGLAVGGILTAANRVNFPTWTTATRPAGAVAGTTGFNTTTGYLETYTGAVWVDYTATSGGGITSLGGQTGGVQTFTNDTNVTISSASNNHTLGWTGVLSLARGGTNKNMAASNGAIAYSDADSLELSSVGTAGDVLTSAGAGAPTWTTASAANANNTIVKRDGSGGFTAGNINASNIFSAGTVTVGQFINGVEAGTLIPSLTGAGAGARGSIWVNSSTGLLKYWDGSAVQVIATSGDLTAKVSKAGDTLTGGLVITPGVPESLALAPYSIGAGSTSEIRFRELAANGADYVGFKAPDSIINSQIWTLPPNAGNAGDVLSTNGSGQLSWVANGGAGSYVAKVGDTMTGTLTINASGGAAGMTVSSVTGNAINVSSTGGDGVSISLNNAGAIGVRSINTAGTAIRGFSSTDTGLDGESTTGTGIKGKSDSGSGIEGSSNSGMSGLFRSANSSNTAPTLVVRQMGGSTADLFSVKDNAGTNLVKFTYNGNIDMVDNANHRIINMADPASAQDAATRAYVLSTVGGIGGTYVDVAGDTMTGNLNLVSNNTPGNPALSFASDTDTGVYQPAANEIAFSTTGVERMRIGASGAVTQSVPNGYNSATASFLMTNNDPTPGEGNGLRIDAGNDATDYSFRVRSRTGVDLFNVKGSGTVELSSITTAPLVLVSGNSFISRMGVSNTSLGMFANDSLTTGSNNTAIGENAGSALTTGSNNLLVGLNSGMGGSPLTTGGQNTLIGANSEVALNNTSASIALGYAARATASNQMVVGSSAAPVNNIYLGSGVSTAAPGAVFIQSTSNSGGGMGADLNISSGASAAANQGSALKLFGGSGGPGGGVGGDTFLVGGLGGTAASGGGAVRIMTAVAGSGLSPVDRIFVTPAGNVGIGTNGPVNKLHVAGNMTIERSVATAGFQFSRTGAGANNNIIGSNEYVALDSGANPTQFAYIEGISTDVADGSEDGAVRILTLNNGAMTEAMRAVSGRVGIGTANPSDLLHVDGSTRLGSGSNPDVFIGGSVAGTTGIRQIASVNGVNFGLSSITSGSHDTGTWAPAGLGAVGTSDTFVCSPDGAAPPAQLIWSCYFDGTNVKLNAYCAQGANCSGLGSMTWRVSVTKW